MTDQTPVCDVREKHVKLIAGSIHAHVNANEHISFAVLIAAEDALLELRRQLTEAQATIERLTKELEADIVTMAGAGQNLQAQRIKLRALQSDAAIGKLVREHQKAISWFLTLGEIALEAHRVERLQCGHNDIGADEGHLGLWPDEVAQRQAVRDVVKAIASYPHEGGK